VVGETLSADAPLSGSARSASPARTSRVGFGVSPKQSLPDIFNPRKVRESVTLSPAREMRALPRVVAHTISA